MAPLRDPVRWLFSKRDMFSPAFDSYIHERSVDIVGALPVDGDQEGEAAVWRKDVHAAVLLVVPGQQGDAAVLHSQRGSHHVQSLSGVKAEIRTVTPTLEGRHLRLEVANYLPIW